VSGPINIHNDHSDTMGARDSGWIQLYGETNQEAYDNFIMAVRIGEHPDVCLPVMDCYDGFITSHSVEVIELMEDDEVKNFVGSYKPEAWLNNPDGAVSMGPLDMHTHYFEHKRQQVEAMKNAKKVILDVSDEFYKLTGRKYGLFEEFMMEDAEIAVVIIGSTAGTAKACIKELRNQGVKAGLIKIRSFRPFPAEEIAAALKNVKAVAVMDKADSFNGAGAPLYLEVSSALYSNNITVPTVNFVYGLGGRDVKTSDIKIVFDRLADIVKTGEKGEVYNYLGVKE
ncbi:MAG: pyruvate ferredoxin oxidoreductase, partial [Oscillospiraceae bacterium]|nr:pyruvate ferredoxin oxidoreductase [Oscillospiraceae bacterium]